MAPLKYTIPEDSAIGAPASTAVAPIGSNRRIWVARYSGRVAARSRDAARSLCWRANIIPLLKQVRALSAATRALVSRPAAARLSSGYSSSGRRSSPRQKAAVAGFAGLDVCKEISYMSFAENGYVGSGDVNSDEVGR